MKYINTNYYLFDSNTFQTWYAESNNGGGFTNGEGKIVLPADTTKLYASLELWSDQNGSNTDPSCWPIQIYFSDGTYNKVKASTVQVHVCPYDEKIHLLTNEVERLTAAWINKQWNKVYIAIDSVTGTIDYYVNGAKIGTFSEYVKTGVKAISCKIKLYYISSYYYTKVRNIIISDQYFSVDETPIQIPSTVNANGWTLNNSDGRYYTESENSTLQVQPDLSGLDDYDITAVNVCPITQNQGDTIKNLQCTMGNYSQTKEIKRGSYFDNLPTNLSTITVTAKI